MCSYTDWILTALFASTSLHKVWSDICKMVPQQWSWGSTQFWIPIPLCFAPVGFWVINIWSFFIFMIEGHSVLALSVLLHSGIWAQGVWNGTFHSVHEKGEGFNWPFILHLEESWIRPVAAVTQDLVWISPSQASVGCLWALILYRINRKSL